jgi:hypothetical protein
MRRNTTHETQQAERRSHTKPLSPRRKGGGWTREKASAIAEAMADREGKRKKAEGIRRLRQIGTDERSRKGTQASRGHGFSFHFGGARVGWSPWRGAHRAVARGRNPTVRRGRRPQRGLRARIWAGQPCGTMTRLTPLTLLRFFREGQTGVRRLTQIGGDERSRKRTQRTRNGRCG